jgi:hypothetical protein
MDSTTTSRRLVPRTLAIGAIALGIAGGSYGVAAAASGSGSSSSSSGSTAAPSTAPSTAQAPPGGRPWGGQRSDETPLTGDALSKVTAIAKAKVPGGTIVRVETDADGNAAYEAHMTNASGQPVTVYVDRSFAFVSVETR